MFELTTRPTAGNSRDRGASENRQPRRLLFALVLLLVALAGVVLQDRQFWFGSEQSLLDSDTSETAAAPKTAKSVPESARPAQAAAARSAKKAIPAAKLSAEPKPADAVVATNRTVLPPLDVEVIAGDAHSRIHPGSNSAKLEITRPEAATPVASAPSASAVTSATNAAEREQMSIEAVRPRASYPLLAQHMNVQGSVVLQAIIGADGSIQNLHVLSGPAILSSAAQQAVREWRFKPVVENGQPVETKAKITVNFTIKVADSSGTTLADSRPAGTQVLSR
ncbi:MAG TPA: TonB family protein [Candidatus Binatus sp.]|nr:TonB family protein [Candidatus Binatus sp.]